MQWLDPFILISMVISLFLNGTIAFLWHKKFYRKLGLKNYQSIQRIHYNEVPRFGGLVFILSIAFYTTYCENTEISIFLKLILLCLAPIILIGLKEDIFQNVHPKIRFITLLFAGWLFMTKFIGPFPNLDNVLFLNKIIITQSGNSFFYIIAIAAIANGMNLIDGVHGLCAAVAISILSSLLFLSYKTEDLMMVSAALNIILILIPFTIINFPLGKIFLGDLGAYSLGLIISFLTIIFFGRHPEISPWGAILILIYPATEVVFSLLRRTIKGSSILYPDKEHLHLIFFYFFKSQRAYKKIANALVTPFLSVLWLFPLISMIWVYNKPYLIWISIILFICLYGCFYIFISKDRK